MRPFDDLPKTGHALPELSHVPELDGLRGIAVLMVMTTHSLAGIRGPLGAVFSVGWAGVDLFFVLSGFLITRILLASRSQEGRWRRFYARRIRRILPLYAVVVLVAMVAGPLLPATQRYDVTTERAWP